MIAQFSDLLSATYILHIHGEYKLWTYHNYILLLLCFHLVVSAVTPTALSNSMAKCYLKKWVHLPQSATRAILYYLEICCQSVSHVTREAKLSLLSCISASSYPRLYDLGLHLHLGKDFYSFKSTIIPS